ncbi:hypothetical protein CAL14_19695 [Bordetella genomosp. 9]|nr:hypothetical protein CAL14_19695 [Bordetella genomosp. 9]
MDSVTPKGTEQWYLYALMLLCAIAGSVYYAYLSAGHNWGDDFGAYLHLAKNLRMGRPYDYLTPEMGAMIPPGFPFVISVWSHFTGWDLLKLKTINVAAWLTLAIITYRLARFYLTAPTSLAVGTAVLCCPFFIFAEQELISDMPYSVISTLCLCLACGASRSIGKWKRLASYICLAAAIFVALLFRPAAVGLLAGLCGYLCYEALHRYLRTRSIDWHVAFGCVLLLLSAAIFVVVFPGPFKAHGANAVANGHFYSLSVRSFEEFSNFEHLFLGFISSSWQPAVLLGIALVGACAGAVSRKELTPLHFFAAVYGAMIILTPWDGGPRYLFPLAPVVFVFAGMFGEYTFKHFVPAWTGKAIAIIILSCLIFGGARQIVAARGFSDDEITKPKVTELIQWIQANTGDKDSLCAFKPRAIMYLAQRRTLHIGFDPYAGTGSEYLRKMGCSYAVIPDKDALGGIYNRVQAQIASDRTLRLVYDNSEFSVFVPVDENHDQKGG